MLLYCRALGFGQAYACVNIRPCAALHVEGDKPCNTCPSCRKALGGNHADLHIIKPEEEGKALGVDEARGLQRLIDLKPYEGGRAVVIVAACPRPDAPAQNALLKTLEEPPRACGVDAAGGIAFAAAAHNTLTVRGLYDGEAQAAQMMAVLQSRGYAAEAERRRPRRMADGRPGRALELLQDDGYWALRDRALAALEQLVKDKPQAGRSHEVHAGQPRQGWGSADDLGMRHTRRRRGRKRLQDAAMLSGEGSAFFMSIGMESA